MFSRKNKNHTNNPLVENLETRRLLAVTLSGGVLTVLGSMDKDEISVSLKAGNASQLTVNVNDVTHDFAVSAIDSIVIWGRQGDDEISVDNVNGVVPFAIFARGGDGKDEIVGSVNDDTIYGGNDDDMLRGQGGRDSLFGEDDNDDIFGGAGDDVVFGGYGNDSISGHTGEDFLKGGPDNDRINGGADDDELWGAEGNDTLMGGDGDDLLAGGTDDDDLDGQAGRDALYGQLGNDDFFGDADEVRDLASTDNGSNDIA